MKDVVNSLENLPWIVRLLLTLFADIINNLIRLFRSILAKNTLAIVLSVIILLTGGLGGIFWIIDLVMVAMNKKIWWIC